MIAINRTAIVVSPGQPFLDWLHRADPTSGGLRLEDLRRQPKIYLLPECENEEEVREYRVLAWGCPSGPSWNPRRAAARPRPRTTSTSNTVLGMRDSTSFLTKRAQSMVGLAGGWWLQLTAYCCLPKGV